MKKLLLSLSFIIYHLSFSHAVALMSPDGTYTVSIDGMTYSVTFNGKTIIEKSLLGVNIDNRLFESALAVPRGEYKDWSSDLQLKGDSSAKLLHSV